ncbi:MAG: ABC transporter permease [Oscillospiraceae bacterium]|nr:ABC transporter permease [Oscillospiraceae bacterium]
MFKTIFGLAFQGLWRRRKQTLLVVAILTISIAFVVMMISSTDSITETNKDYRFSLYGSWYGCIPNGMDGDEEFLLEQEWLDSLGISESFGYVSTSVYSCGFGTIDENFSEMGITMLEGRLPETSSEIALEETYLSSLGADKGVGDEITISIAFYTYDDQEEPHYLNRTYTISGIISEYTRLWSVSNYTTLVGAVVTEDALNSVVADAKIVGASTTISSAYFFTVKEGYEDEMQETVNEYLRETRPEGLLSSYKSVRVNTLAYTANAADANYNTTYVIMIFIISLVAVIVIYILQMQTEIRKIVRLRSLGSTKGQLALLIACESLLTCVPAMIIGTIIGAIGTWLILKLSVFGGSVAVTVSIPWGILLLAIVSWILGVLAVRMVTFLVALSTPLVGRMGMTAKKKKFYARLQRVLISVMSIVLCVSVLFTVLNSLSPIYEYNYWNNMYDYYLVKQGYLLNASKASYEELYNTGFLDDISDEFIEEMMSIPGIKNVRAYTQMDINVLVDGEVVDAAIYVIDGYTDWSTVFDLSGIDIDAFENGDGVLLAFTSRDENPGFSKGDTITLCPDTFTGAIESYVDGEVMGIDIVSDNAYTYIDAEETEFAVVCSRAYFKKILEAMPDETRWFGGTSGIGFRNYSFSYFTKVVAYADRNIAGYATDSTLKSILGQNFVLMKNDRTLNTAYAQDNLQTVILLLVSGVCIAVVVLIILFSTIKLETQREKKRYGILQALGMSRRQRNRELLRTAFVRSLVAVVVGWGAYFGSVVISNFDSIRSEGATVMSVLSSYMSDLTTRFIPSWAMILMTAAMFVAVLMICYVSKLGLNKYTLMEMLREDR